MSEKRFRVGLDDVYFNCIEDFVFDAEVDCMIDNAEVVELLNEQQATIQRMKHSLNTIYKAFEKHYGYDMRNAVWLIDELSYDEIVDELYIAETDSKNRKESSMYWKKKCDEQQATITAQKKGLDEYMDNIIALSKENEQLRKELGDCEKFRYTVFKRLNNEYIQECSIK